jgi:hypothetical protein
MAAQRILAFPRICLAGQYRRKLIQKVNAANRMALLREEAGIADDPAKLLLARATMSARRAHDDRSPAGPGRLPRICLAGRYPRKLI